jgi:ataxin-3
MESIYFEKQSGMLCAQHALNMLLQADNFTAVDLAEHARHLDSEELAVLTGSERDNFVSSNYDDSGFFSIQVISKALELFKIRLIPIGGSDVSEYKEAPASHGYAYICNLQEHWFTIRKFGPQWVILNSLYEGPRMMSDGYLNVFISQLMNDGYHIYVVDAEEGHLPRCEADEVFESEDRPTLRQMPTGLPATASYQDSDLAEAIALSLAEKESGVNSNNAQEMNVMDEMNEIEKSALERAIRESRRGITGEEITLDDDEDEQIRLAIEMSLNEQRNSHAQSSARVRQVPIQQTGRPFSGTFPTMESQPFPVRSMELPAPTSMVEEIRRQRMQFLSRFDNN